MLQSSMLASTSSHQKASLYLAGLDNDWAHLIETVGICTLTSKPEQAPYEALIRAVAYQQLHAKAGDAIISRLLGLYNQAFPTPQQLLATEFDVLRACGFSARKIETLIGIANGALSGLVPTRKDADTMDNETLITRLISLKGIGRWTVEMLLIFTLGREDVLPVDDFGIAEGYKRLKKLELAPKPKALAELGKAWSPYRTVASWYLWRVPK